MQRPPRQVISLFRSRCPQMPRCTRPQMVLSKYCGLTALRSACSTRPGQSTPTALAFQPHFASTATKLVQHIDFADATFPVTADPSYIQDCGIVTCTRWISVATTKWMYDNRMNSTNAAWAAIAGVKCGVVGVFTVGTAGVAYGAWDGYMIYKMNKAMEDASRNRGCVKWKWNRQFGQGFPTDWTWTTPARDAKCKWS